MAFDPAKVDRIEIAESGANSVALVKEDGKWTIPSFAGFPADGAKVSGLAHKIECAQKGLAGGLVSRSRQAFQSGRRRL